MRSLLVASGMVSLLALCGCAIHESTQARVVQSPKATQDLKVAVLSMYFDRPLARTLGGAVSEQYERPANAGGLTADSLAHALRASGLYQSLTRVRDVQPVRPREVRASWIQQVLSEAGADGLLVGEVLEFADIARQTCCTQETSSRVAFSAKLLGRRGETIWEISSEKVGKGPARETVVLACEDAVGRLKVALPPQ